MEYNIGDRKEFSKTISEGDVYSFAGITGDLNPVHINNVAAEQSRFGKRIVHGMLTASFISTVIGMYLPGPGTIYLGQSLSFEAPVYIGDTITASVEITDIQNGKKASLRTIVYNQKGEKVVSGEAIVLLPKLGGVLGNKN